MKTGQYYRTILSGFNFDYSHHLSLDEPMLTSSNYFCFVKMKTGQYYPRWTDTPPSLYNQLLST